MARHLYLQSATFLKFKDNSIVIEKGEPATVFSFPLEDFDLIFLEDSKASITARLITECAEKGVSIVFCDKNFLPNAQVSPLHGHYNQTANIKLQLDLLPYKKKKMWEALVRRKIENQISVLQATTDDDVAIERLRGYLKNVKPGDEHNMEGVAAREYFASLFGGDFVRFSESPLSSALNYGYSIIASCIIRQVAMAGLLDNLGIWHDAAQNANNLSYDLIEPFRQVVDYFVYSHRSEIAFPLSKELKLGMVGLLDATVSVDGMNLKVHYAVEKEVNGFVAYLKSGALDSVSLPVYKPGANYGDK